MTPSLTGIGPLMLAGRTPIGQGRVRMVFVAPELPGAAVKVIRPDHVAEKWGAGGSWYKLRCASTPYFSASCASTLPCASGSPATNCRSRGSSA